jgi:hypothetical protein
MRNAERSSNEVRVRGQLRMVRCLFPHSSNNIQNYTTAAPPAARGQRLLTVNLLFASLLFFVFLKGILCVLLLEFLR